MDPLVVLRAEVGIRLPHRRARLALGLLQPRRERLLVLRQLLDALRGQALLLEEFLHLRLREDSHQVDLGEIL